MLGKIFLTTRSAVTVISHNFWPFSKSDSDSTRNFGLTASFKNL